MTMALNLMTDIKRTRAFAVYSLPGRPLMSKHFTLVVLHLFFTRAHNQFFYPCQTHRFLHKQTLRRSNGAFQRRLKLLIQPCKQIKSPLVCFTLTVRSGLNRPGCSSSNKCQRALLCEAHFNSLGSAVATGVNCSLILTPSVSIQVLLTAYASQRVHLPVYSRVHLVSAWLSKKRKE